MEKWFLLLVAVPAVWFAAMVRGSGAVKRQPALTGARSPERFRAVVDDSGGRSATTKGLALDGVFILLVLGFVPWALAVAGDGAWWLTGVAAGVVDAVEDLLAWRLVRTEPQRRPPYLVLFGISGVKYAAYLSVLVAVVAALCC